MNEKNPLLEKVVASYELLPKISALSVSSTELMVVVMLILTIISLFFGGNYAWGGLW